VKVVSRDGSGQSGIEVRATIQNCSSAGQKLQLTPKTLSSTSTPVTMPPGLLA
jgi:hypothetical protein